MKQVIDNFHCEVVILVNVCVVVGRLEGEKEAILDRLPAGGSFPPLLHRLSRHLVVAGSHCCFGVG